MPTVNKTAVARRFARAAKTYDAAATVQRRVATRMAGLLASRFPAGVGRVLEIGCGTGVFTRMLVREVGARMVLANDLEPAMAACVDGVVGVEFLPGDAEATTFPGAWDVVASCSALQWFSDVAGFFAKCWAVLMTGGLLAVATYGEENCGEVARVTGGGLRYWSRARLEAALAASGYRVAFSGEERVTCRFGTAMEMVRHLRDTGVTGIGGGLDRRGLATFCREYERRFGCDDGVALTYHPVYLLAEKK